ncbi:fungal-specific transcription factor domain-domain-containing protein [Leucosporidium creatinivorum]|uniref:Fungal-specific transcription factor domain-domain-containing protein n=1 Tax=Leucosporidium creatinivorum TaxID=106004 RepID=A0A1Y2G3R0_9BASI|nr:fungal-specific transcription factor domain-domain-containing protein [Leucosporidium creatinivorum]
MSATQSPVANDQSPAAPPKKKRNEGPRSRTGCGTCKGRKKKCTETYIGDQCTRCIKGKFICVPTSQRPSRARRTAEGSLPSDHSASPSTSNLPIIPIGFASTSNLQAGPYAQPGPLPPLPLPDYQSPSGSAVSHPSPSFHAPAVAQPPPPPQQRPSPPGAVPSALLQPLPYPDLSMSEFPGAFPFANFGQELSLYDLLGAVDAGAGGLDFLPSLVGPPSQETSAPQQEGAISAQGEEQTDGSAATMKDLEDALGWEKELLTAPPDHGTLNEVRDFAHQWWSFYRSLNDSYFCSIPNKAREIVKDRMRDLVMGPENDLGRAAISSWCSSHYSSVLLKERSSQFEEWDAKAARYYQQCLSLLYNPSISLTVRIGAILDMRLAQINRHGAAPARFLELAGEAFTKQELGDRPQFNFAVNARCEDLAMRCYCYKDVWRSVCTRGRPTLFRLSNSPDPLVPDAPQGPVNRRTLSIHLGLPVGLLIYFADVSNLIAEAPNLAQQVIQQRGMEIKRRIETWVPDAQLAMEAATDSASYVADLASQEMWRHTALIYLHSSLFRLGPLATPLRAALSQIIKLSSALVEPSPDSPAIFVDAARCPIYFLAGTIAITEADREVCRDGLLACGPGKAFVENGRAIERLWEETDKTGVTPDWREFVEKEGLAVCFL